MSTSMLAFGRGRARANAEVLQNEYASILAKRVNEEKAKKSELRSKQNNSVLYKDGRKLMHKQNAARHQ